MKKQIVKKALVAISGSNSSINGARYAIMLSKTFKWELSVIYVIDTSTIKELLISKLFVGQESQDFESSLEKNGNRYLDFVEELASKKGLKINKILKRGSVVTSVIESAEEIDADLIVLGAVDVNRAKRDLINRFHLDLIMDSKRSVLIAKEENIEEMFKKF